MRGRFITFEGGEGAGKSTQAAIAGRAAARRSAIGVVLTREPGGSPGAEIIRHVLLSGAAKPLGAGRRGDAVRGGARRSCRTHDPAGARRAANGWSATASPIRPASIRARSATSTRACIRALERITVGDTMPDLTFILDVPAEVGLARAARRRGAGGGRPVRERRRSHFTHAAARGLSRRSRRASPTAAS